MAGVILSIVFVGLLVTFVFSSALSDVFRDEFDGFAVFCDILAAFSGLMLVIFVIAVPVVAILLAIF
jgi:hypothetical protein